MVSFRAASDSDHLRAGDPGGAGDSFDQTGGESGDGDRPQVSPTRRRVHCIKLLVFKSLLHFLMGRAEPSCSSSTQHRSQDTLDWFRTWLQELLRFAE